MINIRPETPHDSTSIYQLNEAAFKQKNESELIDKLRQSDSFIPNLSLVAEQNGYLLGHILFSKIHIKTDTDLYEVLSLAPMAVLPEHQKKGIGSLLIKEGLKRAKDLGYGAVLVLGHPTYYPRFGFRLASTYQIECPFPAPEEAWMAIELSSGKLEGKAGMAIFPKLFNEV